MLWCATTGKKQIGWRSASIPGWSRWSPNCAATSARRPRIGAGEDAPRGAQDDRHLAGGDYARTAADRRGVGLVGEKGWRWRNRGARTTRRIRDVASPQPGCPPWWACARIRRQCRGPRRAIAVGWRDLLGVGSNAVAVKCCGLHEGPRAANAVAADGRPRMDGRDLQVSDPRRGRRRRRWAKRHLPLLESRARSREDRKHHLLRRSVCNRRRQQHCTGAAAARRAATTLHWRSGGPAGR
jgi:hypothetical protein